MHPDTVTPSHAHCASVLASIAMRVSGVPVTLTRANDTMTRDPKGDHASVVVPVAHVEASPARVAPLA
jgi:hypothetical protein